MLLIDRILKTKVNRNCIFIFIGHIIIKTMGKESQEMDSTKGISAKLAMIALLLLRELVVVVKGLIHIVMNC